MQKQTDIEVNSIQIDEIIDKNNIVALYRCKVNKCSHLPWKVIQNPSSYIIDDEYDVIHQKEDASLKLKNLGNHKCHYADPLTHFDRYLTKCQKCFLTFQTPIEKRKKKQQLVKCPGCRRFYCLSCDQTLSLFGQLDFVVCINCQIYKNSCKYKTKTHFMNLFDCLKKFVLKFLEYLYFFVIGLVIFSLYTGFMICFLPFYVFVRVIQKSIKKVRLPDDMNEILKILIFPFYLIFMLVYILLHYVIRLFPLMLRYCEKSFNLLPIAHQSD